MSPVYVHANGSIGQLNAIGTAKEGSSPAYTGPQTLGGGIRGIRWWIEST